MSKMIVGKPKGIKGFLQVIAALIYFIAVAVVRLVLWVAGWSFMVPLSLVGSGQHRTPWLFSWLVGNVKDIPDAAKKNRWTKYVEMAWRNPTNGIKGWFKQPVPETKPNPDDLVRGDPAIESASRRTWVFPYWEYWYLREIDWTFRDKHYRWFEVRFGWKFVDGNREFFPTIQFGPRSS